VNELLSVYVLKIESYDFLDSFLGNISRKSPCPRFNIWSIFGKHFTWPSNAQTYSFYIVLEIMANVVGRTGDFTDSHRWGNININIKYSKRRISRYQHDCWLSQTTFLWSLNRELNQYPHFVHLSIFGISLQRVSLIPPLV
jgi:hypothetical protein